jgi:fatty-acyl-CoA synthase
VASSFTPIRSLADIEALERVPLAERIASWDTFELIRRGVALEPDKTALVYLADADLDAPPVTFTHAELFARFVQTANLFHRLGVGPSDAVCTLVPTVPQIFFAQIGGIAAGLSCCVNWMLEPKHLVEILRAPRWWWRSAPPRGSRSGRSCKRSGAICPIFATCSPSPSAARSACPTPTSTP